MNATFEGSFAMALLFMIVVPWLLTGSVWWIAGLIVEAWYES